MVNEVTVENVTNIEVSKSILSFFQNDSSRVPKSFYSHNSLSQGTITECGCRIVQCQRFRSTWPLAEITSSSCWFSGLKVKKCCGREQLGLKKYCTSTRCLIQKVGKHVLLLVCLARKMKTNEKCYSRGLTRSTHTTLAIL